jgi:3-hydroxyisobutyrate dehydrogenase
VGYRDIRRPDHSKAILLDGETKLKKIAFMGLGVMGAGMARNLLAAGFPLSVYNRNRERAEGLAQLGAKVCDSPATAAADADVVVSMLADDAASRTVFLGPDGVLSAVKPGAVLIECSTLTPDWIAELAAAAANKKCTLLDAPVTGSKTQAAQGGLLFIVGGEATVVEEMNSVFEPMGRGVVYMGLSGSGSRMKLINNFLSGVQAASVAEALALTERLGINRDKAIDILGNGAPGSPVVKTMSQRMIARDYGIHFDLELMVKDLTYAKELGAKAGLPLRTVEGALERYRSAAEAGWKKHDLSAVIEPMRES